MRSALFWIGLPCAACSQVLRPPDYVTATEPEPEADCSALPDAPLSVAVLDGLRAEDDLAFTQDGRLVSSDGSSLVEAERSGDASVLLPGTGPVDGMDWLPSGQLVMAVRDSGDVLRVDADGSSEVLAAGVFAYSLAVGPDGAVYVADHQSVLRIEPDSGEQRVVIDAPELVPHALAFATGPDRLFVGTMRGDGAVFVVALDASGQPAGEPERYVSGVGLDDGPASMGLDQCGNLYLPDHASATLYRVGEDAVAVPLHAFGGDGCGHGLEWGSGIGGFRIDALYLTQPHDGGAVTEVVIGVGAAIRPPRRGWR